jgi:hypothetical protein
MLSNLAVKALDNSWKLIKFNKMNKGLHPKQHEKQFLYESYLYIMVQKVRKDLLQTHRNIVKSHNFLRVYSI